MNQDTENNPLEEETEGEEPIVEEVASDIVCEECNEPLNEQGKCSTCTTDNETNEEIKGKRLDVLKNKKLLVLIGIVVIAVVVAIVVLVTRNKKPDFNELFDKYNGELWCEIEEDGSYMTVDTNWMDLSDYFDSDAYEAVEKINEELGFPASVFEKMGETRGLDGRVTEETDDVKVSWTYHPDSGLEVMYEVK